MNKEENIGKYNRNDKQSIFEHSFNLLSKTLKDIVGEVFDKKGKGGLGQLVEELFYGIENNSRQEPDFKNAGLELKCTPLKLLHDGRMAIKERLACTMINFMTIVNETDFEHSEFYNKCSLMLILFYLHVTGEKVYNLRFIFSLLWKLDGKDFLIIKQDYQTIVNKIKNGKAHELSEGDTIYLGACRKGQKGEDKRKQPFSDIDAPTRAFSLKPAYMRTLLEFIETNGTEYPEGSKCKYATNISLNIKAESLTSVSELSHNTFEKIILERFNKYQGKNYLEISKLLEMNPSSSKNKYALISSVMASPEGKIIHNINKSGV